MTLSSDRAQERTDFQDGDQVVLRSGGPMMTVQHHRTDNYVCCYWFRGTHLIYDAFAPQALRLIRRPDRSTATRDAIDAVASKEAR